MAVEVRPVSLDGSELSSVLRLLKKAKDTVGFLPDSAVRDRATRGTLLVADVDGEVAGYVLYDLPRNEVRIRQLVVSPAHRRLGISRHLVDELVALHPTRRGIFLQCRRDFEASKVWPQLGFIPLGERAGRGHHRKPLTTWFRDFGVPDLLSALAELDSRPVAALDVNIVIDLADQVAGPAHHLGEDWIAGAVRLTITDHVLVELERSEAEPDRVRHKEFARRFDLLRPGRSWRDVEDALTELFGERANANRDDIRHLAKASSAGARWFVTRDDRLRRALESPTADLDLQVVSPSEFILDVDRLVRGDRYRPADLAGSDVTIRHLRAEELEPVSRAFVNQSRGEPWTAFRDLVNALAAQPTSATGHLFELDGQPTALVFTQRSPCVRVPVCRVRGSARSTVARHVLGWLRVSEAQAGGAVWLTDPYKSSVFESVAADEGYLPAPLGQTACNLSGRGSIAELRERLRALQLQMPRDAFPAKALDELGEAHPTPATAHALERVFAPFLVLGADLPSFVVPIRSAWATQLLDPRLSRDQLFPRDRSLALRREHVYFRSPRSDGGLIAPARLLWYVSGPGPGAKAFRAVSLLDEIVVGDADRLHSRFAHLGVYSREQVRASADPSGQVMALRFSSTRLLEPVVPLAEYRRLVGDEGRGVALAGPQPVHEHTFDALTKLVA